MNHFYSKYPSSEEERSQILSFLELEAECDKHNIEQVDIIITLGELNKTLTNHAKASQKRWTKDMIKNSKHYKSIRTHSINEPRGYYEG